MNSMQSIYRTLLPLFQLWIIYLFIRVIFCIWNWDTLQSDQFEMAFLSGLRFDMVAICYLNAIWIIFNHIPDFGFPVYKRYLSRILFWIPNSLFIIINFIDIEMINFTGRRATFDFFFLLPEVEGKIAAMVSTYGLLILICAIFIGMFWWIFPKNTGQVKLWTLPIVFVITAIGARGGLQLKPLGTINATIYSSEHLNALAHNSTYSIMASYIQRRLTPVHFFANWKDVNKALPVIQPASGKINGKGQNVVILIMESFASEYIGFLNDYPGYTPFLDSLAKRSLSFSNGYANGRRSMDAVPSILAGIPSMTNESYITTNYKAKTDTTIGKILSKNNYRSGFFHGGHNGTMFFDSFSDSLSINQYHGYNQYPDPEPDSDDTWGIYDEPFLKYMVDVINNWDKPFVATFFSLSSHHPYTIPSQYQNRFPKGTLEIHESIGYADNALKEFFKKAETTKWYNNTLFIITADHASKSDQPRYQGRLGKFRIPMILFHPRIDLSAINNSKTVQQTDILPTVFDFLGLSAAQLKFGESMFSMGSGRALMNLGNRFFYVDDGHLVESIDDTITFYSTEYPERKIKLTKDKETQLTNSLHALIQYYRNGLLYGKL